MKEYLTSKISTRNNYLVILAVFIVGLTGYVVVEITSEFIYQSLLKQVILLLAIIFDLFSIGFCYKFIIEIEQNLEKLKNE